MAIQSEFSRVINGGLVTGMPPHAIGLAESPDCENIDPSFPLGARTRPGSSVWGTNATTTASGTISKGFKVWTRDSGTTFHFIANGTTIYANNGTTWAEVKTGMATDSIMQAVALNNMLVVVASGLRPQISSAGSSLASITAGTYLPTTAKYATLYASKAWIAGSTTYPSRIYFCASNDPEAWATANNSGYITVGDGDGDIIKGLEGCSRAMYVFKRKNTYAVTGDSTSNYRVDALCSWGLVSEHGKASDGQGVFFASDDGIYYARGMNVTKISEAIKPTYDAIIDKSTIAMEVKGDKLFIFYGSAGAANDRALVCAFHRKMPDGMVHGVWSQYASQTFSIANTSRVQQLYAVTNYSTLQIYELDTGSSGAVTAYWKTPDMNFDGYSPKTMMRYFVHMQPDTATTTVTARHYAEGNSVATDNTLTFGTSGSHAIASVAAPSEWTGYHLAMKLSWTGQKTIYGWQAFADIKGDERPPRT